MAVSTIAFSRSLQWPNAAVSPQLSADILFTPPDQVAEEACYLTVKSVSIQGISKPALISLSFSQPSSFASLQSATDYASGVLPERGRNMIVATTASITSPDVLVYIPGGPQLVRLTVDSIDGSNLAADATTPAQFFMLFELRKAIPYT